MSWQAASIVVLGLVLVAGFAWYEREAPPSRVLALVATLAALAVVGRLAFAAVPNVKPTTDIVLFAGYALGAVPGFAVGAVTAVVSNIFLSQGPWTPWQMAGWGGVGIAGALLARALRGREPGRLLLAAVCGVAGLVFGAWMDLYQLTLAAHQDLDSYLALSASSLPYNLAHAIGNVVFCLLIGPVFIRALRRYRRRLEVRWRAPAGVTAATLALLLVTLPASGATAAPTDKAEHWLLRAQNADGGFGAAPGQSSSKLYSGWAGLGLAAAGTNPRDVRRRGGRSLARYVARDGSAVTDIGEIERTILLLEAAGLSPRDFQGRDLIAAVRARRRSDGSIAGFVSYTAFGVLALRAAGESAGSSTVAWLVGAHNEDGGYGLTRGAPSDSDMTGATLQALGVVGRARSDAARRAVAWLRANQNDDGGFGQFKGRDSNAQSTAYAIQGLVAAGAGGATLTRALAYLRGLQRANGSVAYSSTSAQTPVWVTAQALMALERRPLPVATVPRKPKKRRPRASAPAPGASAEDEPTQAERKPAEARPRTRAGDAEPAPAPTPTTESDAPAPPTDGGLRLDRAAGETESETSGGGPAPWLIAASLLAAAAALWAFRRRLMRRRSA